MNGMKHLSCVVFYAANYIRIRNAGDVAKDVLSHQSYFLYPQSSCENKKARTKPKLDSLFHCSTLCLCEKL